MKCFSTRGGIGEYGFIDTFLKGLADDGGLLIPREVPKVTPEEMSEWKKLNYQDLTIKILEKYIEGEIPDEDLKKIVYDSFSTFHSKDITPLKQLHEKLYVLELFHGPTFAFKDIAMQFVGNLYSYVAQKYGEAINVLGATSGDTGAAAIHALRGKPGIKVCILHPNQKVSKVQALQMTTVLDDNVLNLAVNGNFDDCQSIVKDIFSNADLKNKYALRAVNSINLIRLLLQTSYYFYSYFKIARTLSEKVSFCVPTGNFGDIYAGYIVKKMGLPIDKLILATNENDILENFVNTGVYKMGVFKMTYSPAMDIQVASNFERYLYDILDKDAQKVSSYMKQFKETGEIRVPLEKAGKDFIAARTDEKSCANIIKSYYEKYNYLLDPHTACGIGAYEKTVMGQDTICISLSTAHPAKFGEAILECGINNQVKPPEIEALYDKEQKMRVVNNDVKKIVNELKGFYGN